MYSAFDALATEILVAIAELLPSDGQSKLARTFRVLRDVSDPILYKTAIRQQNFDDENSSFVLRAAKDGNIDTLRKAVHYGANIDGPPRGLVSEVMSAGTGKVLNTLYVAILADQYDMIEYLLQKGADVYAEVLDKGPSVEAIYQVRETKARARADPNRWYGVPDGDLDPSIPNFEGTTLSDPERSTTPRTLSSSSSFDTFHYHAPLVHYPLLAALEKAFIQQKRRAAMMLIIRGACWVTPDRTALAYDRKHPLHDYGLKVIVRLLKLLASSSKKHPRHDRLVPAPKSDDDKLAMLRLLCDNSEGLEREEKLTPLAYATLIGRADLTDIAVRRCNNSVDDEELFGASNALDLAVRSNDVATAEVVLRHARKIRPVSIGALCLAVENENDEMFWLLYRHKSCQHKTAYEYLKKRFGFGRLLGTLAAKGRASMLREALKLADLTDRALKRFTNQDREDLYSAATRCKVSCLQVLMSFDAIARDAARLAPKTALHYLCEGPGTARLKEAIRLLVRRGIPIDIRRDPYSGRRGFPLSPLQHALLCGNLHAAQALLECGARRETYLFDPVSLFDYLSLGPLDKYSQEKVAAMVVALIRWGERVDDLDRRPAGLVLKEHLNPFNAMKISAFRCRPLLLSAFFRAPPTLIDTLVEFGANVNGSAYDYSTPISPLAALIVYGIGARPGSNYIVKKLLGHGARLDDRQGQDWGSALDRACKKSRAVYACCLDASEDCGQQCGKGDHRALKIIMSYARRKNLSSEHVLHNLDNYHVSTGQYGFDGRWVPRSSRPPHERDFSRPVNELLRKFLRQEYPEVAHHHLNGLAYFFSRNLSR